VNSKQVIVRHLGSVDYQACLANMQEFTLNRGADQLDEIWLVQHEPVYTQGYACDQQPNFGTDIPVIATDRGGQLTYHGPGQLIVYLLIDISRRGQGVRHFVTLIESAIRATLGAQQIDPHLRCNAPGVYVDEMKIASLGIRVKRGCTYHGMSLNVDMDISPFAAIDVCGFKQLEVTTMHKLGAKCDHEEIERYCVEQIAKSLGHWQITYLRDIEGG